jgi:MFS family permease
MRSRAAVVASSMLMIVAVALPGLLVGSLAEDIRADLGLSATLVGVAVAALWLAAAIGSAPAGRFVDRFGATRGMHLAGALAALAATGAALSGSPALLIASLAVAGLANAFATPGVSALASRSLPRERQGLAFGVQQAGPAIAALMAGLALPVLAGPLGWRSAFVGAAIVAAIAAVLAPRGETEPAPKRRAGDRHLAPLLVLAAGALAANAAAGAALTFLVSHGTESGLSSGAAGALLAGAGACAALVRVGFGALADRRPRAAIHFAAGLLLVGAAGHGLLSGSTPAPVVAGAIIAIGAGWAWPGLVLFAVVRRHRRDPGAAVGVVVTGIFGGAVAGPLGAGFIADRASFELVWWLCAALAVLAAAALLAGDRLFKE